MNTCTYCRLTGRSSCNAGKPTTKKKLRCCFDKQSATSSIKPAWMNPGSEVYLVTKINLLMLLDSFYPLEDRSLSVTREKKGV